MARIRITATGKILRLRKPKDTYILPHHPILGERRGRLVGRVLSRTRKMAWGWKKGAWSQEHSGSKMGKTQGLIFSSSEWTSLQESLQATQGLRIWGLYFPLPLPASRPCSLLSPWLAHPSSSSLPVGLLSIPRAECGSCFLQDAFPDPAILSPT